MSFVAATVDSIIAAQLARYSNRFTGKDSSTESFLGKLSRAEGNALWDIQQKLQRVSVDSVPQQGATFNALSAWAVSLGLSNGAGGYGAKVATTAAGGRGTATGTNGSTIADAVQLIGGDGVTLFANVGLETISGGVATLVLTALTAGTAGNQGVGSTLRFVSSPVGVQSVVTISTALAGGTNIESSSDLLARILRRLRIPPMGGIANDYRIWCENAPMVTASIRAYVYQIRKGTGSVYVVTTYKGQTGTGRKTNTGTPSDTNTIQGYLDTVRPVTVNSDTVSPPYMPSGAACSIRLRIVPTAAYPFDWDSSAGTWTLNTVTDTTHIKLSTLAPADLKSAITAGKSPRIQVVDPISVLPVILTCSAFSDGGGKTTLTTSTAPGAFTVGSPVYAGSAAVLPIATALLALVDSLGPSRLSGYAESDDQWLDSLYIDQLIRVALALVDTGGNNYAVNMVTDPTVNGSATDVRAQDDGANAPQLLYTSALAVTP